MKYHKILIILLFCWSSKVFGQIKGVLIDEFQQPLMHVQVFLNSGAQTNSNAKGEFVFNNILPGTYQLSIQIQEQLIPIKTVTLSKNEIELDLGKLIISKNIQLKEVSINESLLPKTVERMPEIRDNVIYAGKKNEVIRLNSGTANLAQNNSRQIFAKVPGVQIWESDGSGVQMGIATRGLSPNRMWEFNTRQNGYDIASDPFGYPEAYYTPSVESLDRIEIIRGAASLQYGAQFGGVVNYIKKQSITQKKLSVESTQTLGSNKMFSSFNAVGGTTGKWSYYANINYRRSDAWRQNNTYNTLNAYMHVAYQVNKKIKVSSEYSRMNQLVQQPGGLTDSLFRVDPKLSLRERNWFNLNWNIPAVMMEYYINPKHQLNIKTFGLIGFRSSIGNLNPINQADTISSTSGLFSERRIDVDAYKNIGMEVRHLYTYTLGKQKQNLAIGMRLFKGQTSRFRNLHGNTGSAYDLSVTNEERVLDQQFTTYNAAIFAEQLFRLNSKWSISPGFRFEHLENTSQGNYTSTLINPLSKSVRNFLLLGIGSEYKINSNNQIYANATQAYRPVQFSDLTPGSSTDSIDQNLKDAKGYNIDLGVRGNIKKTIQYDISAFYLLYDNRIGSYSINNRTFRSNIGSSLNKGIEAYIEISFGEIIKNKKIGNWSVFVSSTIQNPIYNKWNNPDPTKNLTNKKVENAPQQIHRYGINYQYKKMGMSLQGSYVGGTYSDALNTYAANSTSQIGYIPSYQVFDYSFKLKIKNQIQINAGINNILNTAYFTRRGGGYPGPGLLPAEGRTAYFGLGIKI